MRAVGDGHDVVACYENYSLNGPTYETSAAVIDAKSMRLYQPYYSMCEDGRDLQRVQWSQPTGLDLLLSVRQVRKTEGSARGCPPDQGAARVLKLGYTFQNGQYVPTAQSTTLLHGLQPDEVAPDVRAALQSTTRPLPEELRPKSRSFEPAAISICL